MAILLLLHEAPKNEPAQQHDVANGFSNRSDGRPVSGVPTRDLLNTLAAITGKKAGFRSLGDAWADTTTAHGRLMLTVLGVLAEFERDLIRTRTSEGRERAKARGVKLGRKPKMTEHQKREAIRRRDHDGEPVREIARSYNVSHSTISRLVTTRPQNEMIPFGLLSKQSRF
jgi:DNA invertase Pin-like site-specific DNA recombinase